MFNKIMNSTILQIFKSYFNITALMNGLQYSFKCKTDHHIIQLKPHRLRHYKDIPYALCEKCYGAQTKTLRKLRTHAKIRSFDIISERSTLYINGYLDVKCTEGHTFQLSKPVKRCPKCVEDEEHISDHILLKKKISKIKYNSISIAKEGKIYYLCMPSLSQKNFKTAIKMFFEEHLDMSGKQILLSYDSFKKINFKKVLLSENIDCTQNIEDTTTYVLTYTTLSSISSEDSIEAIHNHFEEDEVDDVLDNPVDTDINICSKMSNEEQMEFFYKHEHFMDTHNIKLENNSSILYNRNTEENNMIFAESKQHKYDELDPIIHNPICKRNNNICHHETQEFINHSFYEYIELNNKQYNTLTAVYRIFKKSASFKCKLDSIVKIQDIEKLNMYEIVDNDKEKKFVFKVVKTIQDLRQDISQFYHKNTPFNVKPYISKFNKYRTEDITLTDVTINEVLAVEEVNNKIEIDPVIMNTIIFCKSDSASSPLYTYFNNCKNICHDKDNNSYIRRNDKYVLLSRRAAQKMFYIDSDVALLFWNIVFKTEKINVDYEKLSLDLVNYCPDNMFDTDIKYKSGVRLEQVPDDIDYIDCTFDLLDFVLLFFKNGKVDTYNNRALVIKYIMIMNSKGITRFIRNTKLTDFISMNYHRIISSSELDILCGNDNPFSLINAEINNMFGEQIMDSRKVSNKSLILGCK